MRPVLLVVHHHRLCGEPCNTLHVYRSGTYFGLKPLCFRGNGGLFAWHEAPRLCFDVLPTLDSPRIPLSRLQFPLFLSCWLFFFGVMVIRHGGPMAVGISYLPFVWIKTEAICCSCFGLVACTLAAP